MTVWYERDATSERDIFFTIYERDTLTPVGGADLPSIDFRNRTANFSITIDEPDSRGKGYGTETTRLMLGYASSRRASPPTSIVPC